MKSIKAALVVALIFTIPSVFASNLNPGGRDGGGRDGGGRDGGGRDGGWRDGGTHIHFRGCGHKDTTPEAEGVPEIDSGSIGLVIGIVGGFLAINRERRKKLIDRP